MVGSPLLEHLKRTKKNAEKQVLLPHVEEWLIENGSRLDVFTEEDFEFLKQLTVIGTKRDASVFSPSGATACQRFQVIDKVPDLRPKRITRIDPKLQRIFDDGKWRHLRWQMLFFKMGIVHSAEIFTKKGDFKFGGSFDLVLELPWENDEKLKRVVLDIKGAHASDFNYIRTNGKPKFAHRLQVTIYMYLTGCRRAIVWYENKNSQDVCEIVVDYDEKLLKKALRRQRMMAKYATVEAFPKEECSVGDTSDNIYRQCPHRLTCPRLPIHFITSDNVIVKTHEPRIIDEEYQRYNIIDLVPVTGKLAERMRRKKGE